MQRKSLIYIANIRLPTERAHGIQIMEMCQAFGNLNFDVELIVTNRKTPIESNPFEYYGIEKKFKITKLWCFDSVQFGWLGFWIESLSFILRVIIYVIFKKDIFYTRDESVAVCLKFLGKKVIWEVHMGQNNLLTRFLVNSRVPMVAISGGLKDLYVGLGMPRDKIILAPDGVDLRKFDIDVKKEEAREKLGLDLRSKIAMYTGNLYSWKGVETLRKAGESLQPEIETIIVSGKPPREIPLYLKAADVLVLPNSAKEDISKLYTSPMKLFEYMASRTPIVASDLPSIREVLSESEGYLFRPDDSKDLTEVIESVFSHMDEAKKKAETALLKVREYSWQKRAEKIVNFLALN